MTAALTPDTSDATPDMPLGRIAFLFTDTEQSSKAWTGMDSQTCRKQLKGEMRKRLLTVLANRPQRRVYPVQDTGDGELIVFQYLQEAVEVAEAFQIALRTNPIQVEIEHGGKKRMLTGAVRMVVHAADEDVKPEQNTLITGRWYYEHTETVKAHRVMSIAEGGHILLSDTAHRGIQEVGPYRQKNTFKRWVGRRIKDFTAETIYERLYEGWTSREPGTAALPAWCVKEELSHYVPRPKDEKRVIAAFNHESVSGQSHHLVTIHADGGYGKSRLATEVAIKLSGFFDGGMFTHELPDLPTATADDKKADALISGIASAITTGKGMGTLASQNEAGVSAFVQALGEKRILILLHNYESVAGNAAAKLLHRLLTGDVENRLYLLVTGRVPVAGPGRTQPSEQCVPLDVLPEKQASDLFLDRVREKRGLDWEPTPNDDPAVSAILTLTERIPLALELVAAWAIPGGELETLADELRRSPLGEITSGDGGSERQDAMRCSLDWSWHKLAAREQHALACLSLFAETTPSAEAFTLNAACKCFDWKPFNGPVTALCNASLVRQSETPSGTRYGMHRFVREYAAAQFADLPDDDRAKAENAFISFWADWMEKNNYSQRNAAGYLTDDYAKLPALDREWRTIAAAQQIAARRERRDALAWLSNIANFLNAMRAQWRDAETVYECILSVARAMGWEQEESASWDGLGNVYAYQGKPEEAVEAFHKSLVISRRIGNIEGEASSLHGLASAFLDLQSFDEAKKAYNDGINIKQTRGDKDAEAASWNGRGEIYRRQNKPDDAIAMYKQCRALTSRDTTKAVAWYSEGVVYFALRKWGQAEQCFHQSLNLRRPLGNKRELGMSLLMLGQTEAEEGKCAAGIASLEEAVNGPLS